MHNKKLITTGFVLVLVQFLLLFLPLHINMPFVSVESYTGLNEQSAIQLLGDYSILLTTPEFLFEGEPLPIIVCMISLLATITLIVVALFHTVSAADKDEGSADRLCHLRTASCSLAVLPLMNCGLALLISNWDWAPSPTFFGILMTITPLGLMPLFKRLSSDFPEATPTTPNEPDWKRFLPDEE